MGDTMIGADAKGGHAVDDIDGEHFGHDDAAEEQTSRSELWTNFVRTTGLRAADSC